MNKKAEAYLNRKNEYICWGLISRKEYIKRMFNEGADFYKDGLKHTCVPCVGTYVIDIHKYEYQYFEQLQKEYEAWAEEKQNQIYNELFNKTFNK